MKTGKEAVGLPEFVERIKRTNGVVRYIGARGEKKDRHEIRVKRNAIQTHPLLSKQRAVDPEIDKLLASVGKTGGEPIFELVCWGEPDGEALRFWLADGHQRFRTLSGKDETDIVVLESLRTVEDALKLGAGLNFCRFEPSEADVLSLLALDKLSVGEVAKATGLDESKVRRLELICRHPILVQAATGKNLDKTGNQMAPGKFCGYSILARLVEACNKNTQKLEAFLNTFSMEYERAKSNAAKIDKQINRDKSKKWPASFTKKRYLDFYGKIDWAAWAEAIKNDEPQQGQNGLYFEIDGVQIRDVQGVAVSDDEKEWEAGWGVTGLEGLVWKKSDPSDLQELIRSLPAIERRLKKVVKELLNAPKDTSNEKREAGAPAARPQPKADTKKEEFESEEEVIEEEVTE